MCFSIPIKVIEVRENSLLIEGNKILRTGKKSGVKKGDYVRIAGEVVIDKLTKEEGLKVRRLIKSLNNRSYTVS